MRTTYLTIGFNIGLIISIAVGIWVGEAACFGMPLLYTMLSLVVLSGIDEEKKPI